MSKIHKMILVSAVLFVAVFACSAEAKQSSKTKKEQAIEKEQVMKIQFIIKGKILTAILYDNSSTKALLKLLEKGDVTIDMHDFSNFEKVGDLPVSLPRNAPQPTQMQDT